LTLIENVIVLAARFWLLAACFLLLASCCSLLAACFSLLAVRSGSGFYFRIAIASDEGGVGSDWRNA
jgi:hypothetical protein